MDWKLDDGRPIWPQLAQLLTRRIIAGIYPPGSRLPPVRELAAQAGVNPNTMQRAMAQLEQNGLAAGCRNAGRTVTEDIDVIRAARLERARAAVSQCLRILEELGYSRADALAIIKEELHDE